MTRQYMIDIETLGRRPDSQIASIGVVSMDFDSGHVGEGIHVNIDLDDSEFYDFTTDEDTVAWWARQSAAAKARTFDKKTAVPVKVALRTVSDYIGNGAEIWSCGSDFDIPMLTHHYRTIGLKQPWEFYRVRDYRTLRELFQMVQPPPNTVHHDALEDAIYQARHLVKIIRHLRLVTADVSLDEYRRKAVVDSFPYIQGFLSERRFHDVSRVRAILTEYENFVAQMLAPKLPPKKRQPDDEL